MPRLIVPTPVPRSQIALTGRGLIAESYPLGGLHLENQVAASGRVYFNSVGLRAGDVISTVHLIVSVAGVGSTLAKVGLYDKTGARLAVSTDLGTAWHSGGRKSHSLSSSFTILADDLYYVAVLHIFSTTGVTMLTGANVSGSDGAFSGGVRMFASEGSQTDLDATATLVDGNQLIWVGVS